MLHIEGKYNSAIVYANSLEKGAVGQLTTLCNQEFTKGAKLRIMPDAHAGAGCVVSTTMSLIDKIAPNSKNPCDSLKRTLNAEIDRDVWDILNSTVSMPFPRPKNARIAVKTINHLGDEVMKVFKLK